MGAAADRHRRLGDVRVCAIHCQCDRPARGNRPSGWSSAPTSIIFARRVCDEDGDWRFLQNVAADTSQERTQPARSSSANKDGVIVALLGCGDDLDTRLPAAEKSSNGDAVGHSCNGISQRLLGGPIDIWLNPRSVSPCRPPPGFRRR